MSKNLSLSAIKIFSIVLWMVGILAIVAYKFDKLDMIQVIIVNISIMVIEFMLVIFVVRRLLKAKQIVYPYVIIPKSKFVDKCVRADDEILPVGIKQVHPWRSSIFKIALELIPDIKNSSLKFYVTRKCTQCSRDACEQEVDVKEPSTPGTHVFNIRTDPTEMINFKFNKDITVKSFSVDELYTP